MGDETPHRTSAAQQSADTSVKEPLPVRASQWCSDPEQGRRWYETLERMDPLSASEKRLSGADGGEKSCERLCAVECTGRNLIVPRARAGA
jgi:hypothetical protein